MTHGNSHVPHAANHRRRLRASRKLDVADAFFGLAELDLERNVNIYNAAKGLVVLAVLVSALVLGRLLYAGHDVGSTLRRPRL